MPIYEYVCADCGEQFEKLMRFSDPNIDHPDCPECRSGNTNKRLSTFASFGNNASSAGTSSCGSSSGFR